MPPSDCSAAPRAAAQRTTRPSCGRPTERAPADRDYVRACSPRASCGWTGTAGRWLASRRTRVGKQGRKARTQMGSSREPKPIWCRSARRVMPLYPSGRPSASALQSQTAARDMSRSAPRERRDTRSWEYTKDVIRFLESSQRRGSYAALGIERKNRKVGGPEKLAYGGAKQYTETRLPAGRPLERAVRHVLGSAHFCRVHTVNYHAHQTTLKLEKYDAPGQEPPQHRPRDYAHTLPILQNQDGSQS